MVFYRKYRSQTINDLDIAAVRQSLSHILKNPESIPHAFLFTGSKGLGKTSTARIVAKVINCERKEIEPCNQCVQCVSITNGTNLDVFEIDAASNRGIDEIRDLKEKIRLAPAAAKKKVYIIDEVHMLTTEAFNALLKTLEEPPEHAVFILCTTEAYKLPETIVSRCFQIAFKKATVEELVRSFKRIVVGEKIAIDEEALVLIAQQADGGFRDGVKILEELALTFQGEKITKEAIETTYKTMTVSLFVFGLINELGKKRAKEALAIVKTVCDQGTDIKYFITAVIESLHDFLLRKIGVSDERSPDYAVTLEEVKELIALLSRAYGEMKYAVLPQLPLELAVIEWTQSDTKPHLSDPEPQTANQRQPVSGSATVSDLRKQVGAMKKLQALYGEKKVTDAVPTAKLVGEHPVDLMHTFPDGEITKEWLAAFWVSLIGEMKKYNHTVAGVLRSCMIQSYDKKHLVIETAYKFHKERLDDVKTKESLFKVCKMLTGNEVEVRIELRK